MVNQSVNDFYTRFIFIIDALPHKLVFPLYIAATFSKNLSHKVSEFLILEGFKFPQILPTETNHQVNHSLLLVRNAVLEAKKTVIKIKSAVQPRSGSRHFRKFLGMLGEKPSIQISGLCSSFQDY